MPFAFDQGQVQRLTGLVFERMGSEFTMCGLQNARANFFNQRLGAVAVFNQVGNGANFEVVLGGKTLQAGALSSRQNAQPRRLRHRKRSATIRSLNQLAPWSQKIDAVSSMTAKFNAISCMTAKSKWQITRGPMLLATKHNEVHRVVVGPFREAKMTGG